jgi:hypothetical protein
MNNRFSLRWIRAIREERVKQSKGMRFCSMNDVAINDAPGGKIHTAWNWNPWGFHKTVSSQHAFRRRNGSVCHFRCILVPQLQLSSPHTRQCQLLWACPRSLGSSCRHMGTRIHFNSLVRALGIQRNVFSAYPILTIWDRCELSLARLPTSPRLFAAMHSVRLVELTG